MEKYQVFFAANKGYFMPMAVTIRSLIDHVNPTKNYELYIATDLEQIDPESKQKIVSMETENVSIVFVDSKRIDKRLNPNSRAVFNHISIDTFARFYIDQLIPAEKYVLYLDVDLLIKDDVAKIFDETLASNPDDFLIAGVPMDSKYLNAGVILFNVEHMSEQKMFSQLLNYAIKEKIDDELALNRVIKKTLVRHLDHRWNCAPSDLSKLIWNPTIQSDLWSKHQDKMLALQLTRAFQEPGIIHFLGSQKPWSYRMRALFPYQVVESFYKDWWECYHQSPYFMAEHYQNYLDQYNQTLAELAADRAKLEKTSKVQRLTKKVKTGDFKSLWRSIRRKFL